MKIIFFFSGKNSSESHPGCNKNNLFVVNIDYKVCLLHQQFTDCMPNIDHLLF